MAGGCARRLGALNAQPQPDRIQRGILHHGFKLAAVLLNPFGNRHLRRTLRQVRAHHRHHFALFQQQTVGERQPRVGDIAHIPQARLIGMRVCAIRNEGVYPRTLTANSTRHIRQNRGCCHHLKTPLGIKTQGRILCGAGAQRRADRQKTQESAAAEPITRHDAYGGARRTRSCRLKRQQARRC